MSGGSGEKFKPSQRDTRYVGPNDLKPTPFFAFPDVAAESTIEAVGAQPTARTAAAAIKRLYDGSDEFVNFDEDDQQQVEATDLGNIDLTRSYHSDDRSERDATATAFAHESGHPSLQAEDTNSIIPETIYRHEVPDLATAKLKEVIKQGKHDPNVVVPAFDEISAPLPGKFGPPLPPPRLPAPPPPAEDDYAIASHPVILSKNKVRPPRPQPSPSLEKHRPTKKPALEFVSVPPLEFKDIGPLLSFEPKFNSVPVPPTKFGFTPPKVTDTKPWIPMPTKHGIIGSPSPPPPRPQPSSPPPPLSSSLVPHEAKTIKEEARRRRKPKPAAAATAFVLPPSSISTSVEETEQEAGGFSFSKVPSFEKELPTDKGPFLPFTDGLTAGSLNPPLPPSPAPSSNSLSFPASLGDDEHGREKRKRKREKSTKQGVGEFRLPLLPLGTTDDRARKLHFYGLFS